MTDSFSGVVDTIRARFAALTPQQQIAAAFVLRRPDDVAIVSMRTLAAHAGVQPVTFVRLARTLGFPTWEAFKEPFVAHMRGAPSLYSVRAAELAGAEARGDVVEAVHRAQLASLTTTRASTKTPPPLPPPSTGARPHGVHRRLPLVLRAGLCPRLCDTAVPPGCRAARRAWAAASRLSCARSGRTMRYASSASSPIRGNGDRLRTRSGRRRHLIAISDSPAAPFAREARTVLSYSPTGPRFPSLVAAWAVSEQLLDVLVARGGARVVEKLKSAEAQLQALGVFVPS